MKKVISFMLLIALFAAFMVPTVFADGTNVMVSSASAERGNTVTLAVSINGNPGFMSGKVVLNYDKNALRLDAINPVMFVGSTSLSGGSANHASPDNVSGDGVLFNATFTILDAAAAGTYTVTANASGFRSKQETGFAKIDVAGGSGTVTVICKHANMSEWAEKMPATCENAQILERKCLDCGENKETKDGAAKLGHDYGKWIKVDENEHKRTCANDPSHVETKEHSWDKGVVTTQPDCKNPGVTTYTCADCGATKTENKPAATGKHSITKIIKDDGVNHIFQCTGCDETKTEEHKYDLSKFEIELEPTCGATGSKKYHCTVEGCTAWFGEEIPATGKHTFETWKTDGADTHTATCTGSGKATETVAHTWN